MRNVALVISFNESFIKNVHRSPKIIFLFSLSNVLLKIYLTIFKCCYIAANDSSMSSFTGKQCKKQVDGLEFSILFLNNLKFDILSHFRANTYILVWELEYIII